MPQAPSDRSQDPRRQARDALNRGELGEAQRLLAQVLKRDPNDDEAWTLMATAQSDPRRRQDCLDRALNLNPANTTALALRAAWAPEQPDPVTVPVRTAPPPAPPLSRPTPEPVPTAASTEAATMPRRPDRRTLIEQARSAPASLQAAQTLAELGQIAGAREMLWNVLEQDASDESVWLALIDLIDDDRQRAEVIEEAATRFPNSALLKAARTMSTVTSIDPAPTTDTLWPVAVKTPLEMIQERATQAGENLEPIRARRVEVSGSGQIFFEVWMSALMGPTKSNFQDILDENPPSLLKAMTWMGLCGGIATLIQIGLTIWTQPELRTLVTQMDRTMLMIVSGIVIAFVWIMPAIGLLINSGAVAIASTVVGGNVDMRAQAFLTAAWQAPLTLVTSFIAFVPYVNLVGGAALLIYEILLSISATQAAQDLEGFQAIVSLVLSVVVMALPLCLLSILAPMLGLNAGQAMQTLGQ